MKVKKVSVVMPVFNEVKTIEVILSRVLAVDFGEVEKEIIVVDDGSKDGTREILGKYESMCKILRHEKNQGKGAAMRSGFQIATGDYVVTQDADLEYDPNDIRKMIMEVEKKTAVAVYGSRVLNVNGKKNKKAGWFYYLGGRGLSVLTNFLYGSNITDEPTGYKMIRKDVLDKLDMRSTGFEFCPELTAKIVKAGYKIEEVPISYSPRTKKEGKKIKLKDGLIAVWTLLKFRFLS